jgi:hypothetical protein
VVVVKFHGLEINLGSFAFLRPKVGNLERDKGDKSNIGEIERDKGDKSNIDRSGRL